MAVVKSVEYLEVLWNSTSEGTAVNLTKGQDETQCIPIFSWKAEGTISDQWIDRLCEVLIIDNSGTAAVTCNATNSLEASDITAQIFVIEFDPSINVQAVPEDSAFTGTTATVTVNSVGAQEDAFMIYSYQSSDITDDANDAAVQVRWQGASTTVVDLSRRASSGTIAGTLYVVDCDSSEWTVQEIELDVTSTTTVVHTTSAFTAVVLVDTFTLLSYETDHSTDDMEAYVWMGDLDATTTYTITREEDSPTAAAAAVTMSVQIIECNGNEWDVQRDNSTLYGAEDTSVTDTITAIDQDTSFGQITGHCSRLTSCGRNSAAAGVNVDQAASGMDFSADNTVRFRKRLAQVDTMVLAYEVIQFAELTPPPADPATFTRRMVGGFFG